MAKLVYTKGDIERLADRLQQRSESILIFDMPHLQSDMRTAAALLRWVLARGEPISVAEVEVNGA